MPDPLALRGALLMARAPGAGIAHRALEPLLGAERCAELQAALIGLAAAWAERIAPGKLHVACETAEAGPELQAVLGPSATILPAGGGAASSRAADAAGQLFSSGEGPVLIIWPELLHWRREHAEGALADLRDGCGVSLGPVFDGGFYLIALARPLPALFALPEESWSSPEATALAIAAVADEGVSVGILRSERGLRRPGDVRAALADPLTEPGIRTLLK